MINATNQIRTGIENGDYDKLRPQQWYEEFYKIHSGGENSNYHLVSRFTPDREMYGSKVTLDDMPLGRFDITKGYRTKDEEIKMIRGIPGSKQIMMGVPSACLNKLATKVFAKTEELIDMKNNLTVQDRHLLSLKISVMLDFLHLMPDMNGRVSEDFMIMLQKQLLDGTSMAYAWSRSGLRADSLEEVVKEEYQEEVRERKRLMFDRAVIMHRLRESIYSSLTNHLRNNIQGIQPETIIDDSFLILHSEKVTQFFEHMIETLVKSNPEFEDTDLDLSLDSIHQQFLDLEKLISKANSKENGEQSPYEYQEINFYSSHRDPMDLWEALESAAKDHTNDIHNLNSIYERIKAKTEGKSPREFGETIISNLLQYFYNIDPNISFDNLAKLPTKQREFALFVRLLRWKPK